MSDISDDCCLDGDDGENIDRNDFDVASFRDYRDFYRAGLHRERVDMLPDPNSFTVRNTTTGCFSFELQAEVIKHLDIGEGTKENPGYITPFAWVSRAWCQEIRKRVLQCCNIKNRDKMHWFMEMINPTLTEGVFPSKVLCGANITVLVLSFVPVNGLFYEVTLRKEFCSDEAWKDFLGPGAIRHEIAIRDFWEELGLVVSRLPKLITFGFCYGSNRSDGFHRLSSVAGFFSPTLRNLLLRPRNNKYELVEPVVAPWLAYDFRLDLARWATATLIYIESPGYVIYPPTRAELNLFANNMSSCFIHNLEQIIIYCGYGSPHPDWESQTLEGTPWEDQIEGVNDFYLPRPSNELHNAGGIYEIRRDRAGSMVGQAGSIPLEIDWINAIELPAFGF